jgi:hypothetical protein
MLSRQIFMAVVAAALLSVATTAPAAAAKPTSPPDGGSERPLTAEELAASDRKVAAAEAYVTTLTLGGGDLATLDCVTPTGTSPDATTQACYVPAGYLSVEARDQLYGHYCGPAVGQVIANYSWAMGTGQNKYTQTRIAGWMQTDAKGYTNAPELEYGLEVATASSPRRPANWDWVITYLKDTDKDGAVGDQLQDYVRANVSGSKMPLAIPVKPHDKNSKYHLSSWPKAVSSPGHWIAAYGWYSYWTGSDFSRIYYTDSSKDEGGSTGKYWNSTLSLAAMILQHTGRFVW